MLCPKRRISSPVSRLCTLLVILSEAATRFVTMPLHLVILSGARDSHRESLAQSKDPYPTRPTNVASTAVEERRFSAA
jgi:hypothetical protein